MPSINTITKVSKNSLNTQFISSMKTAGAFSKAKGYDKKSIMSMETSKGRLRYILISYPQLVIP